MGYTIMENTVTLTKEQASEILKGMLHLQTNIQILMDCAGDIPEDTEESLRETIVLIASMTANYLQLSNDEVASVIRTIKENLNHAEQMFDNARREA